MTVLIFIAVLVLLIVGHELGHFFVAKAVRMKVLEFGVGFPPKIFGKRFGKGETEYTLNWIPFGGFVRILGEDPKDADDPAAFSRKPALLQASVLFAGPFANIVLAFVLFSSAFMFGAPTVLDALEGTENVRDQRVVVGHVLPASPAEESGVLAGDRIVALSVGETVYTITSPEQVGDLVTQGSRDEPISLILLRQSEERTLRVTPVAGLIADEPERVALGLATALVGTVSYPPHRAVVRAAGTTVDTTVFIAVSLFDLLKSAATLSADVSQIAGPVGIASLTGEAARFGFGSLLSFAALLSINLGIINLFPFPALDGGRLLFLGIESIARRKIPTRVAGALNTFGFGLLILLMLAVTVGDIGRIF
mgnify:CR=1 FL=1